MIYIVISTDGHLGITTIDTTIAGIYQMLHRVMAAGLENNVKANIITLNISILILNAIAHTCLSCQINNAEMLLEKSLSIKALSAWFLLTNVYTLKMICCTLTNQLQSIFV